MTEKNMSIIPFGFDALSIYSGPSEWNVTDYTAIFLDWIKNCVLDIVIAKLWTTSGGFVLSMQFVYYIQ